MLNNFIKDNKEDFTEFVEKYKTKYPELKEELVEQNFRTLISSVKYQKS
jgi:hypothetical protein